MSKRAYIIAILIVFLICVTVIASCNKRENQSPFQSGLPLDNTTITITPASEEGEMAEPVVIEQGEAKLGVAPVNAAATETKFASGTSVAPTPEQIQTALKNAGYYQGNVDGKLGPKSKKAITDFQIDNRLDADGKVGPMTWAKLKDHLEAKSE